MDGKKQREELTPEELGELEGEHLPERHAMSVIRPPAPGPEAIALRDPLPVAQPDSGPDGIASRT